MKETVSRIRITSRNAEDYSPDLGLLFGLNGAVEGPVYSVLDGPLFQGKFEIHSLDRGLRLAAIDIQASKDTEISVELSRPLLGFAMVISGATSHAVPRTNGREAVQEFLPGRNVVGAYQAQRSRIQLVGGDTYRFVELQLDASHAPRLADEWGDAVSNVMRPLLEQPGEAGTLVDAALAPTLESIAHQILNCQLQGLPRELFMESKALEILAYELATYSDGKSTGVTAVQGRDVERLALARRIIEKEYTEPPTLMQLARRVGLNDFKLKRGFREAYGITVYGYVRELRMEKARALLESGQFNVTEAASATGYTCFGHFSAAFKKRYGILPREFRKTRTLP